MRQLPCYVGSLHAAVFVAEARPIDNRGSVSLCLQYGQLAVKLQPIYDRGAAS